jgi:hypothetical protein
MIYQTIIEGHNERCVGEWQVDIPVPAFIADTGDLLRKFSVSKGTEKDLINH